MMWMLQLKLSYLERGEKMKKIILWIICIVSLVLGITFFVSAQWEIATNSYYSFKKPYTQYEIQIIIYKWAGILFIIAGILMLIMRIIQQYGSNRYDKYLKEQSLKNLNRTFNMNIENDSLSGIHQNGRKVIVFFVILGCILATVILFSIYKIVDSNSSQGIVRRIESDEVNNIRNSTRTVSENLIDLDRNYTSKSSINDVIETEGNIYKTSTEPDHIEYMPIYDEVFNEEKQIYEYEWKGTDESKICFYYYKNVKIKNVMATYGMSIWFDKDNQNVYQIQYYLSNNDFEKFLKIYGDYDGRDNRTGEMYWSSQSGKEIGARYYEDLEEYWPCSTLNISGEGYIISLTYTTD